MSLALHTINLALPFDLIATGYADLFVKADSVGVPLDNRFLPQIGHIVERLTGSPVTRAGGGATDLGTGARFGMGLEESFVSPNAPAISAIDTPTPFASYLDGSIDTIVPGAVGGRACNFPYDGTRDFSNGSGAAGTREGRLTKINLRSWNETADEAGSTTAGALLGVIPKGVGNADVSVSLLVQAGAAGLPDRDCKCYDGGANDTLRQTINFSTDIAGQPSLGENPLASRGAAIRDRVCRVSKAIRLTDQLANGTVQGDIHDAERQSSQDNSAVDDGTNLTFAGMIAERLVGGVWPGGTSLVGFGGSSMSANNYGDDDEASATEDAGDSAGTINAKNVSVDYATHLIGATMVPTPNDRPGVTIVLLAPEAKESGESDSEYRDRVAAIYRNIIDNSVRELRANLYARVGVFLVDLYRVRTRTLAEHQAWTAGIADAVRDRPGVAAFYNGPARESWVDPNGDATWTAHLLSTIGATTVTFGNVSGGDISGDLLDDQDLHLDTEAGNSWVALRKAEALERRPRSGVILA